MRSNPESIDNLVYSFNRLARNRLTSAVLVVLNQEQLLNSIPAVDIRLDEFVVSLRVSDSNISNNDIEVSIRNIRILIARIIELHPSWMDKIAVRCRNYVISYRVVPCNESFRVSIKFKLCALFYHWVNAKKFSSNLKIEQRDRLISALLSEPEHSVKKLIISNQCYSWKLRKKREIYLTETPDFPQDVFDWPQRRSYKHYVSSNNSSRVIVTFHMGDFVGALSELANEGMHDRQVISIRQGEDVDAFKRVIDYEDRHHVVNRINADPLKIVHKLRKGGVTVVALIDLNEQFGETQKVKFLGADMNFVKGPVLMSILGKAEIIPMVTFEAGGKNHIEIGPVLCPNNAKNETLESMITGLMQELYSWFEFYVRSYPKQWKFLPECPGYLSNISEGKSGW